MADQHFLYLAVIALLIAATTARSFVDDDIIQDELMKRGSPCSCIRYERIVTGVYWFARKTCPDGYGYDYSCDRWTGICCAAL
uniref:mRNA n=1 Tax=Oulactis sp. TaxID=2093647 RepID=A0A4D8XXM8_OULSP|nr:mRNA [Oulactis sp. MM-2018]SZA01512.1 mRNA [Oulactis sp. MM-2018]